MTKINYFEKRSTKNICTVNKTFRETSKRRLVTHYPNGNFSQKILTRGPHIVEERKKAYFRTKRFLCAKKTRRGFARKSKRGGGTYIKIAYICQSRGGLYKY